MKRSILISFVKYAAAFAILFYLVATDAIKIGLLQETLARRTDLFVLAALIFLVVLHLGVFRWMLLCRAQEVQLTFGEALRLTLIGHFWNLAVPGAVGGDVVKAYYVAASYRDKKHEVLTAVALDRIVGLYGLFLLASGAVVLFFSRITDVPSLAILSTFILGVLATSTLFSVLFLSRWIRSRFRIDALILRLPLGKHLARIADALFVYRSHLKTLLLTVLISVCCHGLLVVTMILCTRATVPDVEVPLSTPFVVGPIGLFANAVPLTPGGLGVGESAFQQLMSAATDGRVEEGGNIFLLWRACAYLWMIPGLYLYLRGKGRIERALEEHARETAEAGSGG